MADVLLGKVFFLLVRIKIKRMEVEIRKRESAGSGASVYNDTDTVAKFEVMDGAPVRGECIPIRMFLAAYPALTPYAWQGVGGGGRMSFLLACCLCLDARRVTLWVVVRCAMPRWAACPCLGPLSAVPAVIGCLPEGQLFGCPLLVSLILT